MIYFLQNKAGNIKIGYSQNIENRKKQLQTGNDSDLKIIYIIKEGTLSFEKHIHSVCANYHIQGEWFKKECIDHLLKHPWYKKNILIYRKTITI